MGYIHLDKFAKKEDWAPSLENDEQFVMYEDFVPEHLQPYSADRIVGIKLKSPANQTPVYFERNFGHLVKAKYKDFHETWITFPILRFVYKASLNKDFSYDYSDIKNFFMALELMEEGKSVGFWYLPILSGCQFKYIDLDISREFEDRKEYGFDAIRLHVFQNPGHSNIDLGSIYLTEEDPAHNLSVAISDSLHNKYRKQLWTLEREVKPNDKTIRLSSSADLYDNICIAIGDPDGFHELHVVSTIRNQGKGVEIGFTNEFDRNVVRYSWPAGTEVWYVVPAIWYDLSETEAIFPMIFVSVESPEPAEEYGSIGKVLDSFHVKDGQCEVGITKGLNAVTLKSNIFIFAPNRELSEPVYQMIRSIYDNQTVLNVAGHQVDYNIENWGTDPTSDDDLVAKNSFELSTIMRERVYKRSYQRFPLFNDVDIQFGIEVSQDINFTIAE